MSITPAMVKELRERTGAGVMDCKRALAEAAGELDAAAQLLRKQGAATAAKKAGRIAAEGVVASAADAAGGVLLEINCETDFVAKDESFQAFAAAAAAAALAARADDVSALAAAQHEGGTLEAARESLVAKIGEHISLRRVTFLPADGGVIGVYLHAARIGVMVKLKGGDEQLARDVAMHIAASRPLCIAASDMPAEVLQKEKEVFTAQAAASGKPEKIVAAMVEGRVKKFLKQNALLEQAFVKQPEQSVGEYLAPSGAQIVNMLRFEVGEGLEKRSDDFVAEVMQQAT